MFIILFFTLSCLEYFIIFNEDAFSINLTVAWLFKYDARALTYDFEMTGIKSYIVITSLLDLSKSINLCGPPSIPWTGANKSPLLELRRGLNERRHISYLAHCMTHIGGTIHVGSPYQLPSPNPAVIVREGNELNWGVFRDTRTPEIPVSHREDWQGLPVHWQGQHWLL